MSSITNIAAYRFAALSELKALRARLIEKCREWKLKGTILLSTEGINLFVAGGVDEIGLLLTELRAIPGLEDLNPKTSASTHQPFNRMLVRIKKEIIAFGVDGIQPEKKNLTQNRGSHPEAMARRGPPRDIARYEERL